MEREVQGTYKNEMKLIIGLLLAVLLSVKTAVVSSTSWKPLRTAALPANFALFRKKTIRPADNDVTRRKDPVAHKNDDDPLKNAYILPSQSLISVDTDGSNIKKYLWLFAVVERRDEDQNNENYVIGDSTNNDGDDADVFIEDEEPDSDGEGLDEDENDDKVDVMSTKKRNDKTRINSRRKPAVLDSDDNSGDSDNTSNSVDDIEEIDLDTDGDDGNAQKQNVDTGPIKAIWKTFLQSPPSMAEIGQLLGRTTGVVSIAEGNRLNVSSISNTSSTDDLVIESNLKSVINVTSTASEQLSLLRPNGTDKGSLYRQLLSQFLFPLETSGKRALWLDTEMALTFKGLSVLNLYPPLVPVATGSDVGDADTEANPIVSQFSRAFRIVSPQDKRQQLEAQYGFSSNGLYWVHQMVIKALAHSIQANTLVLNHRVLEKVEELVEHHFESSPGKDASETSETPKVTRSILLSALFELLNNHEEVKSPTVIMFNDNLNWLLSDGECSDVILEETRKSSLDVASASKVLFVAIEPNNDSKSLMQSLPSSNAGTVEREESAAQSDRMPQPTNLQMFPPGMPFPASFFPQSQVVARGFQVVVKNGTATVTPMPATPIPPGFQGSPEMFRKLMEQQQLSSSAANITLPTFSFQLFPSSMSEDEIDEFMRDPDNQSRIKGVLDSLVGMVGQRLNQILSSGQMVSHVDVHLPDGPALFPNSQNQEKREGTFVSSPVFTSKPDISRPHENGNPFINKEEKLGQLIKRTMTAVAGLKEKLNNKKKINSNNKTTISASGKILKNLFEDIVIEAPRDHQLKSLWEKFMIEEIEHRILIRNKRIFLQELKKAKLIVAESTRMPSESTLSSGSTNPSIGTVQDILHNLEHILCKQLISRDQVREIIALALKFQAGRLSPMNLLPTADLVAAPAVSPVATTISAWSLDMALSSVLKCPNPTIGRPVPRSKELISNLASDKHEKALIENVISPQDIGITYDMIGGLEEVKEMMRQCITYPLKYPRLYQEGVANEAVKGLLLFGPPGTGKTMLAKAVATEGGATFMTVDASTIESKWLGDSEKNARAVFTLARKLAPCVIYLDEVDSILASREHGDESSHGTLTSVKTTLMQEWDGLKTSKDRVIVIASTNRPFDLDEAVLRRLPRRIMVDLPDHNTRKEILKVTLANNRVDEDVDFDKLADNLEGYTGSDIKEVCREAVVKISHELAKSIEQGRTNQQETGLVDDVKVSLRPVNMKDFQSAMKKLKASVSDNGRELAKVIEWNAKYGEFKRAKKKPTSHLNLYI